MDSKVLFLSDPEAMSYPEMLENSMDHWDGFNFLTDDIALDYKRHDDFLEFFSNLKKFDYSVDCNIRYILCDDEIKLYVNGVIDQVIEEDNFLSVTVCAKSEEDREKVFKSLKQFFKKTDLNSLSFFEAFLNPQGAIETRQSFLDVSNFESLDEDYYPFLKTRDLFKSFFKSKEKILYLCGEPGTGKSKLGLAFLNFVREINGLLGRACYVKDETILSDPKFWDLCQKEKYDVIIIDDLDTELTSRTSAIMNSKDAGKNTFISQILSFTDGLFDAKTKIVITTNRTYKNLDCALTRKGRMFDILELRPLKKDEAEKIFRKYFDDFEDFWKNRDVITQAELGSEIERIKIERAENVKLKSYLKEEGISKLEKKAKEIGF